MTPDLLREAGEALHGERWKAPLARDILAPSGQPTTERSVRRWASGDWPVPEWASSKIHDLLRTRGAAVAAVLKKLPK